MEKNTPELDAVDNVVASLAPQIAVREISGRSLIFVSFEEIKQLKSESIRQLGTPLSQFYSQKNYAT